MQSKTKTEQLIEGLNKQKLIMRENAELLEQLHPEFGHHIELEGAANITQTWIDDINKIDSTKNNNN